jgi:hypothetical protein
VGGVASSFTKTAWPSYQLTRTWLALRHCLPWSLMTFLADAHRRGVLRQVGAVYQFRSIELQRHLAAKGGTMFDHAERHSRLEGQADGRS